MHHIQWMRPYALTVSLFLAHTNRSIKNCDTRRKLQREKSMAWGNLQFGIQEAAAASNILRSTVCSTNSPRMRSLDVAWRRRSRTKWQSTWAHYHLVWTVFFGPSQTHYRRTFNGIFRRWLCPSPGIFDSAAPVGTERKWQFTITIHLKALVWVAMPSAECLCLVCKCICLRFVHEFCSSFIINEIQTDLVEATRRDRERQWFGTIWALSSNNNDYLNLFHFYLFFGWVSLHVIKISIETGKRHSILSSKPFLGAPQTNQI